MESKAHKTQKIFPKTAGWAAFMEVRKTKRQKQIASETGVLQSKLSLIENRLARPNFDEMTALVKVGIAFALWGEPYERPKKRPRRAA